MSNIAIYRRALAVYGNTRNARAWIKAVRYLRARQLWLLDKKVVRQ